MSASEVIEQIKRLPERDRAEVARFEAISNEPTVRYADLERAREVSARIFESHAELFQKLAE